MKRTQTITQKEVKQQDGGKQELDDLPLTPISSEELKRMQPELPGIPPKPEILIKREINIMELIDKKGNKKVVATPSGLGHSYETLIECQKLNRIFNNLIKNNFKITYHGENNSNNI